MKVAARLGHFYEGQNAYARGERLDACPCVLPADARAAWSEGWREAKRYDDVDRMIAAAVAGCLELRVAPA